MKRHLFLLLAAALAPSACAADNRLGRELADALVAGPVRGYVVQQAGQVAAAGRALAQALDAGGAPADLPAAQAAWGRARASYDRGAAVFLLAAPELDRAIDGRFDDPLTSRGLRLLEQPLFARPSGPPAELARLGRELERDSGALPDAVAGRPLAIDALLGTMSAIAAVAATKLDGSDSPFAHQSHLSLENNVVGLAAAYQPISAVVASADGALDARIHGLLAELTALLQGVQSSDAVRDKARVLRACGALSQALLEVGTALGLNVAAPLDVT